MNRDTENKRRGNQATVDFARDLLPDILFLIWFRDLMSAPGSVNWPAPAVLTEETVRLLNSIDWLLHIVERTDNTQLDTIGRLIRSTQLRNVSRAQLQDFARGALNHWFGLHRRTRWLKSLPSLKDSSDFYLLGFYSYVPFHSVALAVEYLVTPDWRERYRPLVQLDALAGKLG